MGIYDQLDQLDKQKLLAPAQPESPTPLATPPEHQAVNERPNGRTAEARKSRIPERMNVRSLPRVQIRHTFDILKDQLNALQTIQLEAVTTGRDKPTLGDLVQQALDEYLERQGRRKASDEHNHERMTERSSERLTDPR